MDTIHGRKKAVWFLGRRRLPAIRLDGRGMWNAPTSGWDCDRGTSTQTQSPMQQRSDGTERTGLLAGATAASAAAQTGRRTAAHSSITDSLTTPQIIALNWRREHSSSELFFSC